MKKLILRSLIMAVVLGPLSGFATYMITLSNITEYKPPISETEMRRMDKLSVEKLEAVMAAREIKLTRTQWLADSAGSAYFWHDVAVRSIAPFAAIFVGCLCIGALELRPVRGKQPMDATQQVGGSA